MIFDAYFLTGSIWLIFSIFYIAIREPCADKFLMTAFMIIITFIVWPLSVPFVFGMYPVRGKQL